MAKNAEASYEEGLKDGEAVRMIKSFDPVILVRKIYLSVSLFAEKGLMNRAASAAFYFLLSIIPLALLFVFVLDSWLAGYGKISDYFFGLLNQFNPQLSKDFFAQIGLLGSDGKSVFGIVGVAALIWSSRSVFSGMKSAFDIIFNDGEKRSFLADSLISIIFVPIVFVVCIVFFIASVILKRIDLIFEKLGIDHFGDLSGVDVTTTVFTVFVILLITFLLYKFLPNTRPSSSDALFGAVLFTVSSVFLQKGLYGVVHLANYYLVYGIISVLIAGLFWVYILFALFYLFAQFVYIQHRFAELEFIAWYLGTVKGESNFLEKFIFFNARRAEDLFERKYKAGETIFRQGERGGFIYILLKGSVKTAKMTGGAEESETVDKYGIFGERGVLSPEGYDTGAYAVSDCAVLKIPASFYNKVTELDPQFSQILLNSLVSRFRSGEKAFMAMEETDRGEIRR